MITAIALSGCIDTFSTDDGIVIYSCSEYTVYADSVYDNHSGLSQSAANLTETILKSDSTVKADSVCSLGCVRFESDFPILDKVFNRAARVVENSIPNGEESRLYAYALSASLIAPDRLRQAIETYRPGIWPLEPSGYAELLLARNELAITTDRREYIEMAHQSARPLLVDYIRAIQSDTLPLLYGAADRLGQYNVCYPDWMETRDLFASNSLSVNALYAAAYRSAATLGQMSGDSPDIYSTQAEKLSQAINDELWIPNRGFYSAFLYGSPWPMVSQATDTYGQAICALNGIATPPMCRRMVDETPTTPYGQIRWTPGRYHTEAIVDPVCTALQGVAAAIADNDKGLITAIGQMVRASALFGPGVPDLDVATGQPIVKDTDTAATAAALLLLPIKALAGITPQPGRLEFRPCIPLALKGEMTIRNLRYAESTIDITIRGAGTRVVSFTIDGVNETGHCFDASMVGHHHIVITLDDNYIRHSNQSVRMPVSLPAEPYVEWVSPRRAKIAPGNKDANADISFEIFLNGVFVDQTNAGAYALYDASHLTSVSIVPVADNRYVGYSPRPHLYAPLGSRLFFYPDKVAEAAEARKHRRGWKPRKPTPLPSLREHVLEFTIDVPIEGNYLMRAYMCPDRKGESPDSTTAAGMRMAARMLKVNDVECGTLVTSVNRRDGKLRNHDPEVPPGLSATNFITVSLIKGPNRIWLGPVPGMEQNHAEGYSIEPYSSLNSLVFIRK